MSLPPANAETQLAIGRWVNSYIVPADHPRPEDLQRRLDAFLTAHMPEFCRDSLDRLMPGDDPAVWRIRALRLNLPLVLDTRPDERAALRTNEHFGTALAKVLAQGEFDDSVLRFPDRAAFLTQFLLDLAAGHAWSKWYYEEFDSLSALPVGTAIAETFSREPSEAATVLRNLASLQRLEEVLQPLTETDAQKIHRACFPASLREMRATEAGLWINRLLELWNDAPLRPAASQPARYRDALRLFARLALRHPDAEGNGAVQHALDVLLEIRHLVSTLESPGAIDRFVQALASGDLRTALLIARRPDSLDGAGPLRTFADHMRGDTHWAEQAIGILLKEDNQSAATRAVLTASVAEEFFLSSCVGIFLLGPSLVDLRCGEIVDATAADREHEVKAAEGLRYWILVKCLGRARADQSCNDSALRLLAGFRGEHFLDCLAELGPSTPHRVQKRFVETLVATGRIDGRCLLAETVDAPVGKSHFLLLSDPLQDEWLAARALPEDRPDHEAALEQCLEMVRDAVGGPPEHLLLPGRLRQLANAPGFSIHARHVHGIDPHDVACLEKTATRLEVPPSDLARACRPKRLELDYFLVADAWPDTRLDTAVDLTWSLVARAVVKHFARRLIGFHSASPEHLYQNFLAGVGSIRVSGQRVEVQLPRSPLAVVLQLSGVWNQTYAIPWLDGKEVCLLPPLQ